MKKIVINRSYDKFSVSHEAFVRLRELGQQDALKEVDLGAYWPDAATPREPSLNQCGKLIPRRLESAGGKVLELLVSYLPRFRLRSQPLAGHENISLGRMLKKIRPARPPRPNPVEVKVGRRFELLNLSLT